MNGKAKLILIKGLHTAIWLVMAGASFYILYCGISGRRDIVLWVSIGLLILETLVLLANRWTCPLTPIAMKYTDNRQDNFDIYLPIAIARYNKFIFGSIFLLGLALVIIGK